MIKRLSYSKNYHKNSIIIKNPTGRSCSQRPTLAPSFFSSLPSSSFCSSSIWTTRQTSTAWGKPSGGPSSPSTASGTATSLRPRGQASSLHPAALSSAWSSSTFPAASLVPVSPYRCLKSVIIEQAGNVSNFRRRRWSGRNTTTSDDYLQQCSSSACGGWRLEGEMEQRNCWTFRMLKQTEKAQQMGWRQMGNCKWKRWNGRRGC